MRTEEAATVLLEELESGWLEVVKVPGRAGGYIRVAVSVNVEWYRRFCRRYERGRRRHRKLRTIIKRCHTIRALRRLADGQEDGVYAERLREFVEERAEVERVVEEMRSASGQSSAEHRSSKPSLEG